MVHLVPDEAVDVGPVLMQEIVSINPQDTLDDLEERMHRTEHRLLVAAVAHALGVGKRSQEDCEGLGE